MVNAIEYAPTTLQSLQLSFKVHGGSDLRQLVMFVVDKVVEADCRLPLASELESTALQDRTSQFLSPAACEVYVTFEDLCLLENGERPHNTFDL